MSMDLSMDLSEAPLDGEHALARLVAFYENLSLESLAQLGAVYAPDASFKDPLQ